MATLTPKISLQKPVPNVETDWAFRLNETIDILDDTILTANVTGKGTVAVTDDGSGNITISGSSGAGAGVNSLESLQGDIVLTGLGTVTITDNASETITISGASTSVAGGDHSTLSNLDFASAGHTGFASSAELFSASGTLSAEIDSDIVTHAADGSAHHTRYADSEAISALEPTTSALAASGVATDASVAANTTLITTTSGHLQSQIDGVEGSDVDSVNAVTGAVLVTGSQNVTTQTVGQTITVTGPDLSSFATSAEVDSDIAAVSGTLSAEIDSDISTHAAISDAHHSKYTDSEAVSATESARFTMSGTLSAEIDSDIVTHTAISSAHHSRYVDSEAIAALEPTTSELAASGVATDANVVTNATDISALLASGIADDANLVSVSGHLQNEIDAVEAGDVDSINSLTGTVVVVGKGEVGVTVEGQNIVISGTDHATDTNTDTVSDAILGGVGITVTSGVNTTTIEAHLAEDALTGSDGITIVSGTSTIDVAGFRTEFTNASGTLSAEIDSDITTHTANSSAHHVRYTREENDALISSDGITIVSGSNTIDVQGFRTEFVNASGVLQTEIDTKIGSVVEDTTPQLGGDLDAQNFNITAGGTFEAITVTGTTFSGILADLQNGRFTGSLTVSGIPVDISGGGGGGGSSSALGFSGAATAVVKATTVYLGFGTGNQSTTEANQEFYIPMDGTVQNLRTFVSVNDSDTNGNTVTLRKNGASQTLTVSYDAAATGLLSDTSNSFTVVAGDRIAIEVVNAASGGGSKDIIIETVSLEFVL